MTPSSAGASSQSKNSASAARAKTLATRFVDFWWVTIPQKLRGYSTLLWATWSDGIYLTAWPRVAMTLVVAVFLFGFAEGATHWSYRTIVGTNGFAGNVLAPSATADDWGGPTRLVFAENLVLLLVAVGVGTLSANLGVTLVVGYALGDFFLAGVKLKPDLRFNDAATVWTYQHLPLVATYLLFFLLVALPTIMGPELAASLHSRIRRSAALHTAVTAVVQALLLLSWGCMAPMVFRTVWAWSGSVARINVPFYSEIVAIWLLPVCVAAIVTRAVLTRSAQGAALEERSRSLAAQQAARSRVPLWGRALIVAAVITVVLSGFLHNPSDYTPGVFSNFLEAELVFLGLFAALCATFYVLPRMRQWQQWTTSVNQYPAALRLAAATVASYFLCWLIVLIPGVQSGRPGEFGPEVTAILFGLALSLLLLPNGWSGLPPASRLAPSFLRRAPSPATQAAIVVVLVLAGTQKAFADCKDFFCCFLGLGGVAGAAAAGTIPGLGGVAAAAAGYPHPATGACDAERRAVQQAAAMVELDEDQLAAYQKELDQLAGPIANLLNQLQQLAPTVQRQVATHFVKELAQKILELAAALMADPAFMPEALSGGEGAGTFGTLRNSVEQAEQVEQAKQVVEVTTDPAGQIPGKEYVDFGKEMSDYYNMFTHWGDLDAGLDGLEDVANEDNLPDVSKFVEDIRELDQLAAKAAQIKNKMDQLRVDKLQVDEENLEEAKKALAECEAAHAMPKGSSSRSH